MSRYFLIWKESTMKVEMDKIEPRPDEGSSGLLSLMQQSNARRGVRSYRPGATNVCWINQNDTPSPARVTDP